MKIQASPLQVLMEIITIDEDIWTPKHLYNISKKPT